MKFCTKQNKINRYRPDLICALEISKAFPEKCMLWTHWVLNYHHRYEMPKIKSNPLIHPRFLSSKTEENKGKFVQQWSDLTFSRFSSQQCLREL